MTGPSSTEPAWRLNWPWSADQSEGLFEYLEARQTAEPDEGIRAEFAYAAECELRRIMEEGN